MNIYLENKTKYSMLNKIIVGGKSRTKRKIKKNSNKFFKKVE